MHVLCCDHYDPPADCDQCCQVIMMAITNQITMDTSAHLLAVTQVVVDDIFPLSIVMTEMISDDMRALNIVKLGSRI